MNPKTQKEPNMEAREEAEKIAEFYAAEFHDLGLENESKKLEENDPEFEEKFHSKLRSMVTDIEQALLLREKQAWNQAVEACEKVALNMDGGSNYDYPTPHDVAASIKELRRP